MRIKNFVLGLGILVVFALVLWQGIEAFYPSPQWDDYCDERAQKVVPDRQGDVVDEQTCIDNGGTWRNGYCDYYYECQQEYNNVKDSYSQKVFFISLIVAVVAFILGYTLLQTEPVGSALMASGVWSIFYGTVINWRNFTDYWRFGILVLVLILLI